VASSQRIEEPSKQTQVKFQHPVETLNVALQMKPLSMQKIRRSEKEEHVECTSYVFI
jgi:hypothetical protein